MATQASTVTTASNGQGGGPRDVKTKMNYYLDPSKGGITHYTSGTAKILRRKFDTQDIVVHDLRGQEEKFKLKPNAFQFCKWTPPATDLSMDEVRSKVYPEAQDFIKSLTGATRVDCISHLIRRNTQEDNEKALKVLEESGKEVADDFSFGKVVPAKFAHIDQSAKGAYTILTDTYDEETAAKLSKTRWGIYNLWRPLKTIRRDPLCLCDSETLPDSDLATIEAILPPKGDTTYSSVTKGSGFQSLELRSNPNHRWYYASFLKPEECLVFKIYDSKEGRCGHTSFVDPETTEDTARESQEFRFFVFYEDQPAN